MADDKTPILAELPLDRREFVQRLLRTSAFAVPVALGLSTIATRDAWAQAQSSADPSVIGATSSAASTSGPGGAIAVAEPASVALLGLGAAAAALAARQGATRDDRDAD